jgi:hypothetical protein
MSRKERKFYKEETKRVDRFRREVAERAFWSTHDTTGDLEFSKQKRVEIDPEIQAPVKSILCAASLSRLDESR